MSERVDDTVFAVAEAIADGFAVDWKALREQAPHLAPDLEQLATVAEVVEAYRELREGGRGGSEPATEDPR